MRGLIESNGQTVTYVDGDLELQNAEQLMMETREDEGDVTDELADDEQNDEKSDEDDDDDGLSEIGEMEAELNQLTDRDFNSRTIDQYNLDHNSNIADDSQLVASN